MPKSKVFEFRPIAKIHLDELKAIWPADPRIPSPASRRAWSLARKISPARVNSWWYNRKREAKRLRIKIPKTEEYELPIGEPPEVPGDHVNVKEEAVDENIPQAEGVTTEPRGDANPTRLRSEETEDVSLDPVCARNRTFVDLSLEWASSDSGMLDYASSDTACSPVPESGPVNKTKLRLDDYALNFGGAVEWNTFEDSSIQAAFPGALDPVVTRARKQSARNVTLRLDDNAVNSGDTREWSNFDDENMHAVSCKDLTSRNASDSAANRSPTQSFNMATLGLDDCASKCGLSGKWSTPDNSIQVVSSEDCVLLDSASLRICNQGAPTSDILPFTCSLCSGDCISPINDGRGRFS